MSKTERIAQLEQQVQELQEKLDEQLSAINKLLLDVKDLQQFKRFVELSNISNRLQCVPVNAAREIT
jgi:cell division protein FtsL